MNASDLGTAYSGWAALAEDASTAFSNPAGLVRIPKFQVVYTAVGLSGYSTFVGDTRSPVFRFPITYFGEGSASTKLEGIFPSFYMAAPINKRLTFGFNVTGPFGLGSQYDKDSIVRYLATKSKVGVIDIGPSLGFRVNDQVSVGAGFDANYLMFTLNRLIGPPFSIPADSEIKNEETGWGYGWHAGILYQPVCCARIGFSYNSRVWFHTKGDSILYVPWIPAEYRSGRLRSDAPLPERAQASLYIDINPQWAFMTTLFYTHWSVLDKLKLRNLAFFGDTRTDLTINFGFEDEFDYSAGVSYKANEKLTLRTGFQIKGTAAVNEYRNVIDPSGPAVITCVGAHYTLNNHLSYDIAYGHSFFREQSLQFAVPVASAYGTNKPQTNVLGVQMNITL